MLNRLFQLGLSQVDVAQGCATTQPTISRASKGATVRYEVGKAIEKLLTDRELALQSREQCPTLSANLRPITAKRQAVNTSVHSSSTQQAFP
jgi:hypothetical protein